MSEALFKWLVHFVFAVVFVSIGTYLLPMDTKEFFGLCFIIMGYNLLWSS
mgnify:FL=1